MNHYKTFTLFLAAATLGFLIYLGRPYNFHANPECENSGIIQTNDEFNGEIVTCGNEDIVSRMRSNIIDLTIGKTPIIANMKISHKDEKTCHNTAIWLDAHDSIFHNLTIEGKYGDICLHIEDVDAK